MNYKRALENLGLIENEDFTLTVESFEMLPKTETVEVSPAEFDEEGNLLFDAITEEVDVTPAKPSPEQLQAAWEEVQLKECDIALLVSEYIKDKQRDPENDCLNIVDGLLHSFTFTHIERPTNAQLLALKDAVEAKVSQEQISKEAEEYLSATDWMVTRFAETQVEIPEEVKVLRQAARMSIA